MQWDIIRWDIVAALAQVLEALAVLVGVPIIVGQLRQLRTEETHKRWETVRWARSLISTDRVRGIRTILSEIHDNLTEDVIAAITSQSIELASFSNDLELVHQAIISGYVDRDIFLTSAAWDLGNLYSDLEEGPINSSEKLLTMSLRTRSLPLLQAAFEKRKTIVGPQLEATFGLDYASGE